MQPTAKSDVYSFAILIYKVFFCKEPWPVVSMQLLSAVQNGSGIQSWWVTTIHSAINLEVLESQLHWKASYFWSIAKAWAVFRGNKLRQGKQWSCHKISVMHMDKCFDVLFNS